MGTYSRTDCWSAISLSLPYPEPTAELISTTTSFTNKHFFAVLAFKTWKASSSRKSQIEVEKSGFNGDGKGCLLKGTRFMRWLLMSERKNELKRK